MKRYNASRTGTTSGIFHRAFGLILLLAGFACQEPSTGPRANTRLLLQRLNSPVAAQRDSAIQVLPTFVFLPADAPALQAELAIPRADDTDPNGVRSHLLRQWGPLATENDLDFIQTQYPQWGEYPHLQHTALTIAAAFDTPAAQAFVQKGLAAVETASDVWGEEIVAVLFQHPMDAARLLQWWTWADSLPFFQVPIWANSEALVGHEIPLENLTAALPQLLNTYEQLLAARQTLPPASAAAELIEERIYTLLKILPMFAADPAVNNVLQAAPHRGALSTQVKTVQAFLEKGFPVADTTLQRLAANPLARKELLLATREAGHSLRFPAAWQTRSHLAAADLASWLLAQGWLPDRVRLIDSVQIGAEQANGWLYRFEFRARGTRYQGFSGPQPLDDLEGLPTGVYTGSNFEPLRRPQPKDYQRWLEQQHAPEHVIE